MRELSKHELCFVAGGIAQNRAEHWPRNCDWDADSNLMMFSDRDYANDGGGTIEWFSDSNDYFGDYGNYDNWNDNFSDGFVGTDVVGGGVGRYASISPDAIPEGDYHFEYHQSSGNLMLVGKDGMSYQFGRENAGYAGTPLYKNNPEADHIRNGGPLPEGRYMIGDVTNHKGPNSIALRPSSENDMHGRSDFLIHGDNGGGTASEGCIILPRDMRESIVNSNVKELRVVR
ncbi:tlde1 domain-containing protein [Massilia genomosp. 1]|nr:tlde1 domain-containing protein [Massilia genomosp. 1]